MTTFQCTTSQRAARAVVAGALGALALGACGSAARTSARPEGMGPVAPTTPAPPTKAAQPSTTAAPSTTAVSTSAVAPATTSSQPGTVPATSASTAAPATVAVGVKVLADCQTPSYRPTTIIATCGDAEDQITQITWRSYTSSSAAGTGVLDGDSCTPDCAQGSPTQAPGTVSLSQPVATPGGPVFAAVTFTPNGGTPTTFHPGT